LNFPHAKTGKKYPGNHYLKQQGAMVSADWDRNDVLLRRRA